MDSVRVVVVSELRGTIMNWIFIVCRENNIEQTKVFKDFWDGAKFTDNFISSIDESVKDFPAYNRNENYRNGNLTIGLYKSN